MVSKKDFVMNLQDDYSTPLSAKGKSYILMDNVTKTDIAGFKYKINGNCLVITDSSGKKGLTISDYSKLTAIKYGYEKVGKTETYHFVDFIKNNLVDNKNNQITSYKKTSITGTTDYNDYIDASKSGYVPTAKNKKKNLGLTINAKKGSDTIIGTEYNDTITGGTGDNKIIYNSKTFGVDTIKLTKGEKLSIEFKEELSLGENDSLIFSLAKNKKDLEVRNSLFDDNSKIVLKNYYAKDTGATVLINGYNLANTPLLTQITAKNYFEAGKKAIKSYTGSALADYVDASGLSKPTNVKKGKGLTINGKAGSDTIIGSNYADTIKSGTSGVNKITGGKGNDILYGAASGSETTFIFYDGDGVDTVYSGKGNDTVQFYGLNLSDLTLERGSGKYIKDLYINYGDGDKVILKNYFDKKSNVVSSVKNILTKEGLSSLEDFRNGKIEIPDEEEVNITIESQNSDLTLKNGKNYTIGSVADGIVLTFDTNDVEKLNVSKSDNGIVIKNGEDTVTLKDFLSGSGNVVLKDSSDNKTTIISGSGTITGTEGNDIMYNSSQNDIISGKGGKNIYMFTSGDSIDHIYSSSGKDIIKFTDVNLSDIKVSTEDDKLYIKYSDSDRIYIDDFFKLQKDIQVLTSDKKEFSLIDDTGLIISSGEITGTDKSNIIAGSTGNDIITGAKGDDKIIEYRGVNTYVFNKGDGYDRIYSYGTDSHEDILKFNNSTMSDLKMFKSTSGALLINYNGGDYNDTNNLVSISKYFDTTSTEKNKVTRFMLKNDDTIYSIDEDYRNYVTDKIKHENGYDYYQGTYFNDEFSSTSSNEIFSGYEGINVYNFSKGGGVDYVFSTSGKDIINFLDVRADDLIFKKDPVNENTIEISYGGGNDKIVLQDYLSSKTNIKITGIDNTETTVADCITEQLGIVIIKDPKSTGLSNDFIFDELNSSVAQWNNNTAGCIASEDRIFLDENVDVYAVIADNLK